MKEIITIEKQKNLTENCQYCDGRGCDIFNTKEDCPFCVEPYIVVSSCFVELSREEREELLTDKLKMEAQEEYLRN